MVVVRLLWPEWPGGRPFYRHMGTQLAASSERAAALRDAVAGLYERFGTGERFTVAIWAVEEAELPRRERQQARAERAAALAHLADEGLLEEAPGPRGGIGYHLLEEAPEWLSDLLADQRAERAAEEAARHARSEAIQRALAERLSYTTEAGFLVRIKQTEHGLELVFPAAPAFEVREAMKLDGDCKWDPDRRRWFRTRPVAAVEEWLGRAIEAGGTVLPRCLYIVHWIV